MAQPAVLGYQAAVVTLAEPRRRVAPSRWIYRFEAACVALFFALCRLLPIDMASGFGGWLGRRVGPLLGVSRQARRNLAAAFPDWPPAEIERVVHGVWDNLGRVAAEYPHLRRIRVFDGGRVEIRGLDHLERAVAGNRRVILFSGHLANWEIAALAAGQCGLDIAQVYRTPNNPFVDRMIRRWRGGQGRKGQGRKGQGHKGRGEFIPKEAVGRRAVAALRRGAHLTILADQKLNEGIPVRFFGRTAMTAPTVALLALRFGCDVLPARVERLHGARFRLTIEPPLPLPGTGNRAADVASLMTTVNATLERWIRERPEQWFWVHRRWPDHPSNPPDEL
ncbi:MAG: lauroyl acyltransferase [Alphaproteobacteria bacterium]